MRRLLIGFLTLLGACKGSDYAVAEGLTIEELDAIVSECGLDLADFTFESGTLTLSREAEFEKASCVIRRAEAVGKYSGAKVGNAKYVTGTDE